MTLLMMETDECTLAKRNINKINFGEFIKKFDPDMQEHNRKLNKYIKETKNLIL